MVYKEFNEQVSFFKWARNPAILRKYPQLELIHCSHNTQKLTLKQAKRWKDAGGIKGYPDVFLPFPRYELLNCNINSYGLFLEFKNPDLKPKTERSKGGVSEEQFSVFGKLVKNGYLVKVVYSANEAIKFVETYLGVGT